jgi:hypothetical protein
VNIPLRAAAVCARFLFIASLCAVSLAGCATPADAAPDAAMAPDAGPFSDSAAPFDAAESTDAAAEADFGAALEFGVVSDAASADSGSLLSDGHEVLFVGNSYTYFHDLPARYRDFAATLPRAPIRVESVTAGGYTLSQHARDAAMDGTPLAGHLRMGPPEALSWDVVVLQEQSQTPGFPEGSAPRVASEAAAAELASLALARGAAVLVYATWGRAFGDAMNPTLYPDFLTMESRLESGYRAIAAAASAVGARVRIAPVGAAFARVHAAVVASGLDPLTAGSDFLALYADDGSHPSPRGSYLAACVIAGAITGTDPRALPDAPGLAPDVCAALRDVAAETLADPAWAP